MRYFVFEQKLIIPSMGLKTLDLSPNYDILSWSIDISFCGAHSMTSNQSLIKPFIILGINGPTQLGKVYVYSVPSVISKEMIVPISDPCLNDQLIAELSFKGLAHFDKDWKFTLVDTKTEKQKTIINQEPLFVRPRFRNTVRQLGGSTLSKKPDVIQKSRLQLHIKLGSFLESVKKSSL